MFEQWPEGRRRWFLITFNAFAWLLFANSLAALGDRFSGGGIGPDAAHAAGIIGSIAGWVVLWAMFRLDMRHWIFAFLFGLSLNSALVEFGFRDHAAAGIWAVACDHGSGTACANLANYYDEGRSPVGGSLDATSLHRRACEAGGPDTLKSCTVAERLGARSVAESENSRSDVVSCRMGIASACLRFAERLEQQGRYESARAVYRRTCAGPPSTFALTACEQVLASGFHAERLAACEAIDENCLLSSDSRCALAQRRCTRARSPYAGTDR